MTNSGNVPIQSPDDMLQRRIVELEQALADAQLPAKHRQILDSVLAAIGKGVIRLDPAGEPIFSNSVTESILRPGTSKPQAIPKSKALSVSRNEDGTEVCTPSASACRILLESIPHIVFTAGLDGSLEYTNQYFSIYTGASREELYGYGWQNLIHRRMPIRFWRPISKA